MLHEISEQIINYFYEGQNRGYWIPCEATIESMIASKLKPLAEELETLARHSEGRCVCSDIRHLIDNNVLISELIT